MGFRSRATDGASSQAKPGAGPAGEMKPSTRPFQRLQMPFAGDAEVICAAAGGAQVQHSGTVAVQRSNPGNSG